MAPESGASMTSRDSEASVRADHAGGALGGEDQVDAERAAPAGDVDEAGDEVGEFGDE